MPENWVEFYKDGFFGYGEEGDFAYFSFWHFLPIIVLVVGIVLTYIYRDRIAKLEHEKTIRFVLGCLMLLMELGYYWRVLYVGPGDGGTSHSLMTKLPLQVCEWTCIFAALMMFTESKHLFDIDVTVCLTLGIAPLLLPAVLTNAGPAYFRYYQYWLLHILPIYSVFYMMFVKGYRYDIKTVYKPFLFLVVLSILSMIANHFIPDGSYMYLQGDDLGEGLAKILPANQFLRFAVFAPLTLALFGLEYLVFFLIRRAKSRHETKQPSSSQEE